MVDEGKSLAALLPDIDLHLGRAKDGTPPHPKGNVTVAVSIRAAFHEDVLTEPMSWHAVATGDMVSSNLIPCTNGILSSEETRPESILSSNISSTGGRSRSVSERNFSASHVVVACGLLVTRSLRSSASRNGQYRSLYHYTSSVGNPTEDEGSVTVLPQRDAASGTLIPFDFTKMEPGPRCLLSSSVRSLDFV